MQLLATAEQMKAFDKQAMESYAIPGLVLMENAGRSFVDLLSARRPLGPGTRVLVATGRGNNGGDGFVIARHLLGRGCDVDVVTTVPGDVLAGDAKRNWEILTHCGTDRLRFCPVEELTSMAARFDVIVDAVLGTGFRGPIAGLTAEVIGWMNAADAFVASVDVPSGIDGTTGGADGPAVHADLTITMGLAKQGLYVGMGAECAGEVVVGHLGYPAYLYAAPEQPVYRLERADVAAMLPRRARNANKYSSGKVLMLAGSRSYTGAPALASTAALVSGAGAVVLCVPVSAHAVMAAKLAEVIVEGVPETATGTAAAGARTHLDERAAWADVVAIGPGLGRNRETDQLVIDLVRATERPVILDADGLNAFAGEAERIAMRPSPTILTPHAGELSRLTGESSALIEQRRIDAVREAAERFKACVVLKGAPTATAGGRGHVVLNPTGNPGMATIGAGDVLTGVVAGLAAQGMRAEDAAAAGAFVHGLAGDIAAEALGQRAVRASDILAALPQAFREVERGSHAG